MARILTVALLVLLTIAALAPIRSYDFFWHLATGRWIVEHRALPATDPFAVASDRVPWINGEWLFEIVLYGAQQLVGFKGLSWLRALFVAGIFTFLFVLRRDALLLITLAFAGAWERLDVRPSTAAALLIALAIAFVHKPVVFLIVTAVWINVHPSALLAPFIALVLTRKPWLAAASAAALLINPHGWRGIAAPLELTMFVSSGEFVNAEWLPSPPLLFPLLYVTIAIGIALFATSRDKREHMWRFLLFAVLAVLAIRHVRHQGLYFAAMPLLLPPLPQRKVMYALAAIPIAWVLIRGDHRTGIDETRFPVRAVAMLKQSGLRGNIYNPDQFGGYLIWTFYPERRALTDGRNELYRTYIAEYARARVDSRAWNALLRKYDIQVAVEEYRPPLEVIDAVTKQRREMPAALAYFPPKDWELIGRDEVGMVFARREILRRRRGSG